MSDFENRTILPLAASSAGCSCCSTEASTAAPAAAAEFGVEGLTCGHCVQTVEKAVSALEGVESASVDDGHLVRLIRETINHADHRLTGEPTHN